MRRAALALVVLVSCHGGSSAPNEIVFPTEMCVGFGFYVGDGVQIDCIRGSWGN